MWSIFAVFVFLGVAAACILVFKAYKAKKNRAGTKPKNSSKKIKMVETGRPESYYTSLLKLNELNLFN